jgi:hypothetical protein
MLRKLLAGVAVMAALAGPAPFAFAQQSQSPSTQPEAQLVGLPVYSSDGEKLGQVTDVQSFQGRQVLRADMGTFLGLGPSPVLIPDEVFERKADRIEVAMTAADVKDTVAKQKEQKQQQQKQEEQKN